jgi:chemotaxis protein MotB
MAKSNSVIIKRVKKVGGGHHGGAWKVAYADFVTAMMAFFLLLWLLNATTDAQKRGIADYFAPSLATKSLTSGAGGVLGGRTMTEPGSQVSSSAPPGVTTALNQPQDFDDDDNDDEPGKAPNDKDANANSSGFQNSDTAKDNPNDRANALNPNDAKAGQALLDPSKVDLAKVDVSKLDLSKLDLSKVDPSKMTQEQFEKLKTAREESQFAKAEQELRQAIQQVPDLKQLAQNLVVERTSEGLRIQLVDQDKNSMFPLGSTDMNDKAKELMAAVAQAIEKLPNKIAITGHTDATPFVRPGNYSNWELSTDRANASRRALVAAGLPPDRIETVVGKADTDPMLKDNPGSPQNRRISIVVLRDSKPPPGEAPAGGAAPAAPAPAAAAPPAAPAVAK